MSNSCRARGVYKVTCLSPNGLVLWTDTITNAVLTEGKNLALDTFLDSSGYIVTGPYMGLISSTGYSAISASDTMNSHSGWREAGLANTPNYTGTRQLCVWSAATNGTKALSSAASFVVSVAGVAKGVFIVFGPGASGTIDSTTGTLWSAGLFNGGDKTLDENNTLNITYTTNL